MKLLSSNLSKPRRRIYSLLTVGGSVAGIVVAVGALVVWLGYSSPDVTLPFWECGLYLLLLSSFNLGIYAVVFWQMNRLKRRDGRGAATAPSPLGLDDGPNEHPEPAPRVEHVRPKPANPVQISRRVRGTVSSLKLDP